METHVVTIGLEFCDGRHPPSFTCELFRGEEQECRELCAVIPGASHDTRAIFRSHVRCDTIQCWQDFVRSVGGSVLE
jgi:hypothetical protein